MSFCINGKDAVIAIHQLLPNAELNTAMMMDGKSLIVLLLIDWVSF